MTKAVHDNSSIECLAAEIISRKIVPSSFINIEPLGRCFSYKCYRNSEATIKKELSPKEAIHNEFSLLENGSKLECENLFVIVNKSKPYKYSKINHTGRHKAQTFCTREYTFAKISKQIQGIPDAIPPVEIKLLHSRD